MKVLPKALTGLTLFAALAAILTFAPPAVSAIAAQHGQMPPHSHMTDHAHAADHGGVEAHGNMQEHGHMPQHGQAGAVTPHQIADPEALLAMFAGHLALSDEQQETLAEPFANVFSALQELHRAHAAIVAELDEGQAERFGEMMHELMSSGRVALSHGDH